MWAPGGEYERTRRRTGGQLSEGGRQAFSLYVGFHGTGDLRPASPIRAVRLAVRPWIDLMEAHRLCAKTFANMTLDRIIR